MVFRPGRSRRIITTEDTEKSNEVVELGFASKVCEILSLSHTRLQPGDQQHEGK